MGIKLMLQPLKKLTRKKVFYGGSSTKPKMQKKFHLALPTITVHFHLASSSSNTPLKPTWDMTSLIELNTISDCRHTLKK